METNTQQERAKSLEQQAREYLMQSNDPIFTKYLQQLLPRIQRQPEYVDQLQAELDKSVEFWHQRQQINADRGQETGTTASAAQYIRQQAAGVTETQTEELQPQLQPDGQFTGQQTPVAVAQTAAPKKQNAEYLIATIALSVVGGIFILTALVLLGMYFMNGWIKGISLYVVSLGVVLIAELLIHRKLPKLAQIFSAIGVAALYLSTMINMVSLHNFGMIPAAVIIAVITVGTVLLSRKRDSLIHRLLAIAACWLCVYPLFGKTLISETEGVLILTLIFVLSVLSVFVPVRKYHTASQLIQFVSTTILFPVTVSCMISNQGMPVWMTAAAFGIFFLIAHLILVVQSNYIVTEKQTGHAVNENGLTAIYIVFLLIAGITTGTAMDNYWRRTEIDAYIGIITLTGLAFVAAVFAGITIRTTWRKWLSCYFFSFVSVCAFSVIENNWPVLICFTALLLVTKILTRFTDGGLKVLDVILTTSYGILLLANGKELPYAYLLLAGTILSMFLVYGWTTYQEIVLTFALAFYAAVNLMPMLKLPAFSGILFVSILLFNNVKYMCGKSILVYNVFVLIGQIGALIALANPVYRNSYLTYLCMFVFVLAYLVLTLQEKYYKSFKHRELIIMIFLTYMALIVKTNVPVINSVLIMLIALVSVTLGFLKKDKPVRIYGLVLSLGTCGKIALYDYWGAPVLQKMILFFIVGVIALMIAGIYIILEKKTGNNEKADREG